MYELPVNPAHRYPRLIPGFAAACLVLGSVMADAALIFAPNVAQNMSTAGAFNPTAPDFDPNFKESHQARPIDAGFEGELSAGVLFASPPTLTGSLAHTVERTFMVTEATDVDHSFQARGVFEFLRTLDVPGAFYNLTVRYQDLIVRASDGAIVSVLEDQKATAESQRGRDNPDDPFGFNNSQRVFLAPGNYTLRGILNFTGTYSASGWNLNMEDFVFGRQGLGSEDADDRLDQRGFQSRVVAAVPEPSTFALLGVALLGVGVTRRCRR